MKWILTLCILALLVGLATPAHAQTMCKPGAHLVQGVCKPLGWLKLTLCPKFPIIGGHGLRFFRHRCA